MGAKAPETTSLHLASLGVERGCLRGILPRIPLGRFAPTKGLRPLRGVSDPPNPPRSLRSLSRYAGTGLRPSFVQVPRFARKVILGRFAPSRLLFSANRPHSSVS